MPDQHNHITQPTNITIKSIKNETTKRNFSRLFKQYCCHCIFYPLGFYQHQHNRPIHLFYLLLLCCCFNIPIYPNKKILKNNSKKFWLIQNFFLPLTCQRTRRVKIGRYTPLYTILLKILVTK